MAQEIDAVTIPELPDGVLVADSLLTFAGADGKMYKTTASSVASTIFVELPPAAFSNDPNFQI